jgi:hypothetical protein
VRKIAMGYEAVGFGGEHVSPVQHRRQQGGPLCSATHGVMAFCRFLLGICSAPR